MTSTSGSALTYSRQPPSSSSPPEPICLSDSLDEDLTAPSLDSISHALALLSNASKGLALSDSPLSPPPLQMPTSSPPPVTPHYPSASQLSASIASTMQQHCLSKVEAAPLPSAGNLPTTTLLTSSSTSSSPAVSSLACVQAAGLSLASRTAVGPYGLIKASGTMGQIPTQRLVTMASSNHRPSLVMGVSGKMHPYPAPSPLKQRPPPTASPLLPPHQKGFVSPSGILGAMGSPQGLAKSSAKASGSNGSMSSGITPSSSPSSLSRSNSSTHPGLQSFCPPSPVASSPSLTSHTSHASQVKSHTHHHHHQANFITPMQATLTKSSHSSNSSPIIKLTPRPPAPTPPPTSSSPSPSSSPSHPLSHQMILSQQQQHQYSPKTPKTFRPPFSVSGGGQVKQSQCSYSFAGGQKAQSTTSNSSINNSPINKGVIPTVCSRPDKTPLSSASSVSANHGQRQRAVGGGNQSSKAGNGWAASGTLATSSTTSHLSQVCVFWAKIELRHVSYVALFHSNWTIELHV